MKKLSLVGLLAALAAAGFISRGWFCGQYPTHSMCVATPTPAPSVEPIPTATPSAVPTVQPTAPPTSTPTPVAPPVAVCDEGSIPLDRVVVDSRPYGRGFDSTLKVKDVRWCAAHGMAEWGAVCPMAPEGDRCRNVRERYVLAPHVCPRFVFLSCDPTGNPFACPGTFDPLIGNGQHYINAAAGCPMPAHENPEVAEAFWVQPSGHGVLAACLWKDDANGKPLGCGRSQSVNQ